MTTGWWKDTEIADFHTSEVLKFLERNKDNKFFLLFTPHNVHSPKIPGTRFLGSSGLAERGDMLLDLDASIGEILPPEIV